MSTCSYFGETALQEMSQRTFPLPVVVFFIEFGVSLILLNLMPKLLPIQWDQGFIQYLQVL